MYILNKLYNNEVIDSKAYFDDTLFTDATIGVKNQEEPHPKKRGVSNDKINVSCIIDENRHSILNVTDTGRVKAKTLINEFKDDITPNLTVVSDSERSYHKFMKAIEAKWHKIPSGKSSYKGETLEPVNNLHSLLKDFMRKYHGVSSNKLQGYVALFKTLRRFPEILDNNCQYIDLIKKIWSFPTTLKCANINKDSWIYE